MPSNYYIDIPTALIIILSFIHGYRKGILAFLIPFIAIAATLMLFPIIYSLLSDVIIEYNVNVFFRILLFIIIYIVLRIIFEKFRTFLESILKVIFLQWVNKFVGGVFISSVALAIIWLIYVVLAFIIPDNPLELNSVILNSITNAVFTRFQIYDII